MIPMNWGRECRGPRLKMADDDSLTIQPARRRRPLGLGWYRPEGRSIRGIGLPSRRQEPEPRRTRGLTCVAKEAPEDGPKPAPIKYKTLGMRRA